MRGPFPADPVNCAELCVALFLIGCCADPSEEEADVDGAALEEASGEEAGRAMLTGGAAPVMRAEGAGAPLPISAAARLAALFIVVGFGAWRWKREKMYLRTMSALL